MKIMIKDPNSPYLYTLSQGKLLSNLAPYSSTYPNRPNVSVPQGFHLYIDYLLLFQLLQVVLMRQQSCSTNL